MRVLLIGADTSDVSAGDVVAVVGESLVTAYHRSPPDGLPAPPRRLRRLLHKAVALDMPVVIVLSTAERAVQVGEDSYLLERPEGAAEAAVLTSGSAEYARLWTTAARRAARDLARLDARPSVVVVAPSGDGAVAVQERADALRAQLGRWAGADVRVVPDLAAALPGPDAATWFWESREPAPDASLVGSWTSVGGVPSVNVRTAQVVDDGGQPLVRLLCDGTPARYLEVYPSADRPEREFLNHRHTVGAALCAAPGGGVVGSFRSPNDASVWFLEPGSTDPVEIGPHETDEAVIRCVRASADGTIWVGTYPNARVLRRDPRSGTWADVGVATGEASYVWSLLIDEDAGALWAGVGPDPALHRHDLRTGMTEQFPLPPGWLQPSGFVTEVFPVSGGLLVGFAVDPSEGAVFHLLDPSGQWHPVGALSHERHRVVRPRPDGQTLLAATQSGELVEYDLHSGRRAHAGVGPGAAGGSPPVALAEVDGGVLTVHQDGTFRVTGSEPRHGVLPVPPSAATVHSLGVGPSGELMVGTYLSSGCVAAVVDDEIVTLPGPGQVDAWLSSGNDVIMAAYPGAAVYRAGLSSDGRSWDRAPELVTRLGRAESGQDRPAAAAMLDDTILLGTVAAYGQLQGALASVDPDGVPEIWEGAAPTAQSVTAVAARGQEVLLGSCVHGALGSKRSAPHPYVRSVDARTRQVQWSWALPAHVEGVVALVPVSATHLLGLGLDGTLFVLDGDSGRVRARRIGRGRHPSAWGYGASLSSIGPDRWAACWRGRVVTLGPDLSDVTVVRAEGARRAATLDGRLYTSDGQTLEWIDAAGT